MRVWGFVFFGRGLGFIHSASGVISAQFAWLTVSVLRPWEMIQGLAAQQTAAQPG